MSYYFIICVIVMAAFTYLPRMLPLTFFRKEIKSPFIQSLLYYVPYAVLSSLTFPSVFYATGNIYSASIACLVAIYFSYKNKGLVFVAGVAIVVAYIVNYVFVLMV